MCACMGMKANLCLCCVLQSCSDVLHKTLFLVIFSLTILS